MGPSTKYGCQNLLTSTERCSNEGSTAVCIIISWGKMSGEWVCIFLKEVKFDSLAELNCWIVEPLKPCARQAGLCGLHAWIFAAVVAAAASDLAWTVQCLRIWKDFSPRTGARWRYLARSFCKPAAVHVALKCSKSKTCKQHAKYWGRNSLLLI